MVGDESATAQILGQSHHLFRHHAVMVGHQQHVAEGIKISGIKTASDDDEVGLKGFERRGYDRINGFQVSAASASSRQWDVEVKAIAVACSCFFKLAQVHRVEHLLMDGEGEDIGVLKKCLLRAVAMMDIPIDDGHAINPALCAGF